MSRLSLWLLIAGSLAMILSQSSCGKDSGKMSGSQTSYVGTPGQNQQLRATPTPSPAGSVPSSSTASSTGVVILGIEALPQRASDTLVVTIENRTNQVILFPDHLTNCTVILLQRNVPPPPGDGQWETISPCMLATVTQFHSLDQGQRMKIALEPPYPQWIPGLYRAALGYKIGRAPSALTMVFSSRFQMNF